MKIKKEQNKLLLLVLFSKKNLQNYCFTNLEDVIVLFSFAITNK